MMIDTQHRLRLLLEAEGRPGLLSLLQAAHGAILDDRFRLDELLAVGRQSYVYAATDRYTGQAVVVKQPAFDYRQPLRYNRASAARWRQALEVEYQVLLACTSGHLPRPIALLAVPSPVPAAIASPVLSARETFLVEERIAGQTLTETALGAWPARSPGEREREAARLARAFVSFWEALHAAGWHYGDLNADNLILPTAGGGLRVVDGGSAVPAGEVVTLRGYTPAFTTPRLFDALTHDRPIPGNLAAVLPPLAKILHFALTRQEPLNGTRPDLEVPALAHHSLTCREVLAALLHLDSRPEQLAQAREVLARWES